MVINGLTEFRKIVVVVLYTATETVPRRKDPRIRKKTWLPSTVPFLWSPPRSHQLQTLPSPSPSATKSSFPTTDLSSISTPTHASPMIPPSLLPSTLSQPLSAKPSLSSTLLPVACAGSTVAASSFSATPKGHYSLQPHATLNSVLKICVSSLPPTLSPRSTMMSRLRMSP